MYSSLSNIQKHLYSLIKQNNPEYLQQSIRQNIKEARSWKDEHPEEYAANVAKRDAARTAEEKKQSQLKANREIDAQLREAERSAPGYKPPEPKTMVYGDADRDSTDSAKRTSYWKERGINSSGLSPEERAKVPDTTVNSDKRISPTYWVTHSDFQNATGEKYDVMNAKHRQLFFDLNSSGESTVAPTAGVGEGPAYDSQAYHTMRRRPANITPRYIDVDGKKVANPQSRYDTVDGTIANTTPQSRARAQWNADNAVALKRIDAEAAKRDVEIRAEARRIVNGEQQTSTSTQGQQRYPVQNQSGNSDIGIDITQQSPDQIAAMNDPFRGGQSGRFGKPKQREMDTWGQGSLPNNSGGMQNANQAMDLTGKSVNSKVSRIA